MPQGWKVFQSRAGLQPAKTTNLSGYKPDLLAFAVKDLRAWYLLKRDNASRLESISK